MTLFVFLVGLFLGSFLLVVADRSGQGQSFVKGRSRCDSCGHVLNWYELIPVLSYFMQRGRCRHCRVKLSFWFPFSELITGLVVATVFTFFFPHGLGVLLLYEVISLCLLAICFSDMRYEIIPFPLVGISSFCAIIAVLLTSPQNLVLHLFSALGAGLAFLLIFLITKGRGMGFGDVVYAVCMGLLLGYPGIFFGLYLAFVIGAIISLILVALKKKKLHGGTIPFGPFLVLGTFIMMIWAKEIMHLVTAYVQ